MLDHDAELIPNRAAAGVRIGSLVAELLDRATPLRVEQRIGCRVLDYGAIWVFDTDGTVSQVCVWEGYRGKVAAAIGVGSSLAEIEAAFGPVVENEVDEFEVSGQPGWSFDIDPGSPPFGSPGWGASRVRVICIHPSFPRSAWECRPGRSAASGHETTQSVAEGIPTRTTYCIYAVSCCPAGLNSHEGTNR